MNQPKEQAEVPEAAVLAAARRISEGFTLHADCFRERPCGRCTTEARNALTAALPAIEQAVEERVRERLEALDRYAFFDGNEEGCGGAEMLPNGGWLDRADVLAALSQSHNTEEEK